MLPHFFKRFRMERDLTPPPPPPGPLPHGYFWLPWDDGLLDRHAAAKARSFRDEIDSAVFPSLGSEEGCRALMWAISKRHGFIPGATWLIAHGLDYCATVQGVRDLAGAGMIQNLGVAPEHRGRGLGGALLLQALAGFRTAGVTRAVLEVTAQNEAAVNLYRKYGFRARRIVYKAATDPAVAGADF